MAARSGNAPDTDSPDPLKTDGVLMADDKLNDVERYAGGWWFTRFADGKGTIQGPFKIKHDAQQAQKQYEESCSKDLPTSSSPSPSMSSAVSSV